MIVSKFGGSSLASPSCFRRTAELIRQNPDCRYVVVSAPGKRSEDDTKITDLLYRYQQTGAEEDLRPIRCRFEEIARELEIPIDLTQEWENIRNGPGTKDFLASRGEYLCARLMAAYLGWPFVDAAECVLFDEYGRIDLVKTQHATFRSLRTLSRGVIPGFYGAMPDGQLHVFPRGGSDITGALVASAMDAQVYENWTDVDGFLVTDPGILPSAAPLGTITYRELRELAYRGASVLHEDSVVPLRRGGIPIHLRNTFHPEAKGTWIVPHSEETPPPITGIAGRLGYSAIQIERENTNSMVGYVRRILSCLEKRNIPFDHLATGLGSVCVIVPTEALQAHRAQVQEEIFQSVHPDSVEMEDGLAMVSVVGRGMVSTPGVSGRILSALGRAGINVRVIDQGAGEMNIVIGVSEKDYHRAVQTVYWEFF